MRYKSDIKGSLVISQKSVNSLLNKMKIFGLTFLTLGVSAWTANDYATHQFNAADYEPIQHVALQEQEIPIAYQPALTEETVVETINDRAIWNKLERLNGLEYYTHAHHGFNAENTHPTESHEYPEEHHHYRHTEFNDRQPVTINRQRKVYKVNPKRYARHYGNAAAVEEAYAEDIFFSTMKDDTLHTPKFLKAHQRTELPQFGGGAAD